MLVTDMLPVLLRNDRAPQEALLRLRLRRTSFFWLLSQCFSWCQPSIHQPTGGHSRDSRRTRATNILLRVVLAFALCWLPLHVHILVAHFGYQPRHMAYEVYRVFCHILAYSGSIINPFVYNFYSKEFRSSYAKTYRGIVKSVIEDQVSTGRTQTIQMSELKQNATLYSAIQTDERNPTFQYSTI